MGQYLTAQAKKSIEALPKDKEYYAAFNYGEIVEIREESDRLRVEWQIPDFVSLRRETSDAFISPIFNFLDSQCYLMFSPFVDDDVEGWSDVYVHSKTLETSVTYTLGIKKVDGTVEDISTFTGTSREGWFPPLEEKFLKMGDLLERRSMLISSGVLTVIFTIRRAEASDLEGWLYLSDNGPSNWIHLPGENSSEIECVWDSKTEKGESLPEIECAWDSKTAQDKEPKVICLPSDDDVEKNPKPSVRRGIRKTTNNHTSSGIQTQKLKYRRASNMPKTKTKVQPYPFSEESRAVFNWSSTSTFVSKETQTNNSAVYKECQECDSLQTKSIHKFTRHLEDLLLKSEDHDVIIDVQNHLFKAHKFILMARSPVFASMFQHDMEEKASGNISIEDCDPDAFGEFLNHVYTGKAKIDSPKTAIALYYAGDKYDFHELKEMCVNYLKETTFGTATVCDVIKMAMVHDETDLLEIAFSFFSENLNEILQTDEWQCFLQSNVTMANDMLKRAVKNLSKKTHKRETAVFIECPSCSIK